MSSIIEKRDTFVYKQDNNMRDGSDINVDNRYVDGKDCTYTILDANILKNDIIVEEWKYLSEGMGNVVLRYVGSKPIFMWKVLRLSKIGAISGGVKKKFDVSDFYKCGLPTDPNAYLDDFILPRLSSFKHCFPEYIEIPIDRQKLEYFQNLRLSHDGPLKSGDVNLAATRAVLMSNLAAIPIPREMSYRSISQQITLEFKPKSPVKSYINDYCLYCLLQYYKFDKGQYDRLVDFCPGCIFIQDKELFKSHFSNLLQSNYIKWFVDGIISDKPSINIDELTEILGDIYYQNPLLDRLKDIVNEGSYNNDDMIALVGKLHEQGLNDSEKEILIRNTISRTLLDVSVLLTIQLYPLECNLDFPCNIYSNYKVYYQIKMVDIDLKPFTYLPLSMDRHREAIESANRLSTQYKKTCHKVKPLNY